MTKGKKIRNKTTMEAVDQRKYTKDVWSLWVRAGRRVDSSGFSGRSQEIESFSLDLEEFGEILAPPDNPHASTSEDAD